MIRAVKTEDAEEIKEIYNYYILNSIITFEESPVSTAEMGERINTIKSVFPWIVYEKDHQILGYAYAARWRSRSAYARSVESTVYLKPGTSKKGIGTQLYTELIKRLKEMDLHVVIGGISLPNDASVALHEKLGFKKVAHFKEVGFKFNNWIDVGYWELLI
ncbi:N-acetyltransferase family protein [Fulvivirgaceae bacterium BMA12]|uniref:N-acetyltransferase family protein n=1 Tax=Agaribacillus aureus TaxID=3051825 RepID=A0ABT8L2L1_9BACT|nr:N-acetyltransferase family protein [Fulvivirgaceae bacterium BMA12]